MSAESGPTEESTVGGASEPLPVQPRQHFSYSSSSEDEDLIPSPLGTSEELSFEYPPLPPTGDVAVSNGLGAAERQEAAELLLRGDAENESGGAPAADGKSPKDRQASRGDEQTVGRQDKKDHKVVKNLGTYSYHHTSGEDGSSSPGGRVLRFIAAVDGASDLRATRSPSEDFEVLAAIRGGDAKTGQDTAGPRRSQDAGDGVDDDIPWREQTDGAPAAAVVEEGGLLQARSILPPHLDEFEPHGHLLYNDMPKNIGFGGESVEDYDLEDPDVQKALLNIRDLSSSGSRMMRKYSSASSAPGLVGTSFAKQSRVGLRRRAASFFWNNVDTGVAPTTSGAGEILLLPPDPFSYTITDDEAENESSAVVRSANGAERSGSTYPHPMQLPDDTISPRSTASRSKNVSVREREQDEAEKESVRKNGTGAEIKAASGRGSSSDENISRQPSRSDERSRSRASSKGNSGRGPLPQRRKGQGKQGKAAKRLAKGTASEKGMWDRYSRCRGEHDGATADDGGPTATAERDVGSCVPGDYNQQAIIHMHESDGVDGDETARGRLDAEVEHQKSFWSTSDDETTNAGFYRRLNIRQKQGGRCSAARDGEGHCHQGAQDHHEEHFHKVEHERPSEEIDARVDRDPWDPRTCLERFDARRHDLRLHAFWLTEVPHRRYVTWWDPEHGRKRVWRIPPERRDGGGISNCKSTSAAINYGDWVHDHHSEEEEPEQREEATFSGAFHQFCDGVAPQRGPRGRGGKRTHHPRSGRSKKKTRGAGDGGKKSEARSEAVAKRRRRAGSSSTNTSTCSSGTSVSSDDNDGPHPARALRRAKEKRRKDRANAEAEREEEQPTLFLLYDVGDARVWESVKKAVVEVVESHSAWNEEGFGKADQAWDSAVNPPRQGKFFRDGELGNEVLARVGDKLRTLDRGVSFNAGQEVDRRPDEEDPDGLPTAAAVDKEGTLAVRKKTPPRTFAEAIAVKKRRHEKKRQRAQKRKMQREQRKALKEATTACSAENAKNAKQGGRKAGDSKSAKPRGAQSFDEMLKEVDRCLADHSRMKRVFADSAIQKALWPEAAVVHDDAALRREDHTSCWSGPGGSSDQFEQGGEQIEPQAEEAGGEFSTPRKPSFSRGARHSTPKTREELDDSDEDLVAEACHAIVLNMQQKGENSSGQALPNAARRATRSSALDDEKAAFLALARRLLATFRAAMKDAASDSARAPWPRKKGGLAGRQQVREQLAAAKSVEDGLHVLRKVLRARIKEERTLEVANREQDVKEILTDPVRALQWSHLRSQLPLQFQDEATRWRAEYEAAVRLRIEQEDAESGDESVGEERLRFRRRNFYFSGVHALGWNRAAEVFRERRKAIIAKAAAEVVGNSDLPSRRCGLADYTYRKPPSRAATQTRERAKKRHGRKSPHAASTFWRKCAVSGSPTVGLRQTRKARHRTKQTLSTRFAGRHARCGETKTAEKLHQEGPNLAHAAAAPQRAGTREYGENKKRCRSGHRGSDEGAAEAKRQRPLRRTPGIPRTNLSLIEWQDCVNEVVDPGGDELRAAAEEVESAICGLQTTAAATTEETPALRDCRRTLRLLDSVRRFHAAGSRPPSSILSRHSPALSRLVRRGACSSERRRHLATRPSGLKQLQYLVPEPVIQAVQLKLAHTRLVAPWKYNRWRRALGAMTGVHVPKYKNKQLGSPKNRFFGSGDKFDMKEKERSERWFDPEVAARRRLYESYLSTKFGAISHHPDLETDRKLHEIYGDAHVGVGYSGGGEDELGPRRAFVSEVERMCYVDWLGKVAARRSADGSQPLREMLLTRTAEFAEKKWDMLSVFREACRAECLPATAAEEDEHRREMKGPCGAGGGDEHGNEEGSASAADASAQASDVGAEEENAREPADAISSPSQGEEQTTVPAPPPAPLAPDLNNTKTTAFDAAALIEKVRLASTVPPELLANRGGVLGHFLPAETEKDEFLTFVYAQECRQFVGGRIFEAWPRDIALQLMNMGYAGKNLIRDLQAAPKPATTGAHNSIPSPEGLLDFWTRYQICDRKVQAGKIKSAGIVTQHWMEFDLECCTDGTEVERESLKSTFNQAKNPVNCILRTLFENDVADRPVGQVGPRLAANKSLLSDKLRTAFPQGNIPSLPHIQRALEDARQRGHLDPINCDPEQAEEFETLALSILERHDSENREDDGGKNLLANFVHDWNRFKYGFTDSNWGAIPALDPVLEQQRVLEVEKKKWMQREELLAERGINLSTEIFGRGVSGGEDVNANRTRARQLRIRMEEPDDDFLSPGADSETHVAGGISIDGEGMSSTSSSTDAGEDEDEAEDLSRDSATAERSRADYAQHQQQQWAQAPSSYGAAGAEDYQDEVPEARERYPEPPLLRPAAAKRRRTRAVHGEIDAGELASASDDQGLDESEDTFSPGGEDEGCEKMRLEADRRIRKQNQRRGERSNTAVEESCAAVTCSGSLLRASAAQRGRLEPAEEQSSVPKRSESSVSAAFRDRSVPGAAVDETGQSFRAEKRDLSPPAVREHDETAGRGARVEDYCRENTQKDEQVDYNDWSWSQHDWKSWNAGDVEDEGRGCAPPNTELAEEVRRVRNDPYVSSALSCAAKGSPISLQDMRETWWEQSKQGGKMGLTESQKEEHRQRFPFDRDAIDAQVARDAALDGLTANRGTDGYHTAGDVLNSAHMSLTASLNTVKAKKVRLHDEVTELLRHDQVMVENAFQEQLNGTYDKYCGHRDVEGIFFKRVLDPEDIDGMIGCIDQVAWEFAQYREALRVRKSLEQRDARREATLEVDDEALLPSFVLNPMNKHASEGQESWCDDEDDAVGGEEGGAGAAVVGLGADGVAPGAGPTPEDENQQSGVADAGADLLEAAGGANDDAARAEGAGEATEASAAAAKVDHLAKARKKGRTLQQAAAAKANAGSSLRVASDRRATETHFPSQAKIFERLGEVDENVKLRLAFAARLQNLVERKLGIQRQRDVRGAANEGNYFGEQEDQPTAAAKACDVTYPHLAFMYVEQFRAIFLYDPNAGGHRNIQLMCWYPPPGELAALAFGTCTPPPHIVDGVPHFESLPRKHQMEDRQAYNYFCQKERGFRERAESFVCDREQDQNITLTGHWLEVCAVSEEAVADRPQYEDALTANTRVAMERTLRKSLLAGLPRLRASEYKKLHTTTFAGAAAGRGVVAPSAHAHLNAIGKRGGRAVASSSQSHHLHGPGHGGPRGATSTRGVRKRNSVRGGHHTVAGSPSHGQEQVARDYERRRRQWAFAWQATLRRLTPAALREACASSRHIQKMQQKARERRAPLWTRYTTRNPDVPPPTPHVLREARLSRHDPSRRQLHNEGRWVRAEIRNCLAGLDAGAMDYERGVIGSTAEDGFYYPADNTTVRHEAARYAEEDQEREKKERHGLQHGCNHYPTIAGRAVDASHIQPNDRRDQDVLQLRRKWRQRLFRNGEMQVTPVFSPDSLVFNYAVAKEVIFNEQHVLAKEHQLEVRSHEALRRKAAAVGNDDQMDLLQQVADHQDGGSCSASRYIDLPIRRYRKAFLELLHAHRILLVDGRTGTGKSTQIPLYIADDMNAQIERLKVQQVTDVSQIPPWLRARENAAGNLYRKPRIVLTQPKRYGAIKTATSLHEMEGGDARQGPLGERIGYRVGQLARDKNCEICFMTSTWLLQKLTHHPEALGDITHLILDEMHDRNVDIDFLCMVLKVLLAQPVFQDTKVVVMSATLEKGKIEEFFNGCQGDYGARIPRLEIVHGTPFQITKFHVEDLGSPVFECFETWANSNATAVRNKFLRTVKDKFAPKMSKFGHKGKNQNHKPQSQTMSQLIPGMIDLTVELLRDIFIPNAREKDAVERETAKLIERFGRTTLVFLPGQGEMSQLEDKIDKQLLRPRAYDLDVRVFWLHSNFQERGEGLKEHVERGGRAIVLATNIAESGVTIEDVGVVIDYGMEKVSRCSDEGGSKADALLLAWSSQASVTQRQGRTGRVRHGVAIRLFPKWIWDRLDAFETSEVAREDINRTVLRCALSIAKLRERFQVVPGWMEQKQRKRVWGWDAKQDAWRLEDGTVVPETELQVETEDGFNIGQFLQMLPDPPAGAAVAQSIDELQRLGLLRLDQPTVLGCAALGFTCSLPVGRMMLFAVMCGYVEEAVLLAACITALASSKGGDDFLLKTGKDMDMSLDKPDYVPTLLPRRGKEGEYDDGESPEDYMKRVFEMRWQCGEWMHAWRTMFNGDTYSEVSALYKVLEYILQCQNGNDEFALVPRWANWNEGRHNVENPDELGVPQIPPLPGVARSHPEIFQTTQEGGGNRMIPGSRGGGAPPPPGPLLSGQGLRRLNQPLEKEMLRRKAWIDVQDRVLDLCQNFTREVHYDWVTKRVENLAQAVKLRGRRVPIQLRKDFDPNFWIGFAFAGTHLGVSRGEVAAQVADRNYRLCRELPNPDRLCRKKENPPGSKEKKPERNALKVFFSQALEDHETVSQRDLEAAMEEHKLGFPLISVNLRAAPGENAKNKKGAEQVQPQLAEGKGKPTKKPTTLEFYEHFIKADTQHFGRCLVPVGDTNKLMFCTRRACPENDGPVQKMTAHVLFDMTHYQYEHFCLEKRPKEKDEERLSRSEVRAVQLVKEGRQTEAARLMKREHKASASKSPKEKAKNPTAQHSHARQGRSESKGTDEDAEKGGVAGNKHLKGLRTPVPDFIIRRQRRLAAVETHRRDCFALCVASLPTTAHRGPNEHENEPHQGTKRRSAWADAFFCSKPEWMHTLERAIAIDDDLKKLPEPHSGFARQLVEHQEKRAMIISDGENGARKKRDSQGMSLFYCGSRVSSASPAAEADQKRVKIFFYDPRFARDDPEGASAGRRPYVCALLCQAKQVFSKISRQGRPTLLRAAGSGARSSRQVKEPKWSHEWPPSLENKTYYRGYRCTRLGSLRGHVDKNFWKGRDFGKKEIALGLEKRAAKGWAEQPVAFGVANVTKLRQKKLELIRRRSGVTETTSSTTRSFADNDQEDAFSPPAAFDEFLISRSATGELCRINRLHHGHHEARERTEQHGRRGVDVPQQLATDARYRQLRRFYGELRLLHQNEYDNENDRGTADLQDLELDWEKSYSTHLEAHWFAGSVWQYLSEDLRPFEQTLFPVPQSREEVTSSGKIFDRQGLWEEQRAQQQRRSNEASSHGRDRRGAQSRKSEKKERHSSTREPSEEDDRDGSESGSLSSSSEPLGEGRGRKNRPSSSRAGGGASAKYVEVVDFISEASSSEDEGVRGSSSGTPSSIEMIIADEKKKARLSRTLAERFPYRFPPEFFDYLNRKGEQTCAAMTSLEDHWLREYFADNVNYSRAERLLSAAGVAICAGDLAAQTTQTSGIISSNTELLRDWLRIEKLKYTCVSKEEYWNKLQLHNERHRFFNRYLDLRDEQTQGKMEKAADREVFDQMQKNYKPRNGVLPLECEVLLRCGPPDEQYPLTWIAYEQMNMEEQEEGQTRERQHQCHFGPFKLEGKEEWRLLRDKSTDYKSKVTFEPCVVDRNGTLATMLEDFSEVRLITGIAVKEKVKAGARDAGGKNKKNQSRPKPAKRSFELSGTTLLPRLQGVDLFLMNAWPNYEIPVRYVRNAIGEYVLISVGFDYEEWRIPEVNLAVINDFRRCTNLLQRRTYNPRAGRYKNNEQARGRKAKPAGAVAAATTSTDWPSPDEAAAANGKTRSGGTTLGAVDAGKQELPDVEGAAGEDHTSAPNDAGDDGAVNATSNEHPQMVADEEEHDDEPEVPNYLEWLGDGIFCAGETYKDQKELELPKTGSETASVARAGQRTTAAAGTGDHVGNYSVGAQTITTPGAAATGLNHQKKRFRGEGSLGKHMQGSGQYMHMVNVDHTARIREAMGRILHKDAVSDGVYFEKQRPFSNAHNFFNKAIAAGASPFELHEHMKLRGTIPFRRRDKITRMDAEGEDAFYELMDQGFHVFEGFLWIANDGEWTVSSTSIERLPASLTHADLYQAFIPASLQLLAVMQEWFRYKEDLEECGQFSRAECCAYWDARFAECFQSVNERFWFAGSGRDWWVCCYNEAKRQLESRGLDKECFANAAHKNRSQGGRDRSHFSSRSVGGGFSDSAVALFRRTVRSARAKWTHSERLQALPQGVQDLVLQWVSGDVQLFAPMGNNGALKQETPQEGQKAAVPDGTWRSMVQRWQRVKDHEPGQAGIWHVVTTWNSLWKPLESDARALAGCNPVSEGTAPGTVGGCPTQSSEPVRTVADLYESHVPKETPGSLLRKVMDRAHAEIKRVSSSSQQEDERMMDDDQLRNSPLSGSTSDEETASSSSSATSTSRTPAGTGTIQHTKRTGIEALAKLRR